MQEKAERSTGQMMMYIVRHGETEWNRLRRVQGHTDIELNDYGRRLARETAAGMEDVHLDLCFTSPLKRAKETALLVLGDRTIPVYDEPRIQEIGFGSYEGVQIGGEDEKSRLFARFFSDTGHYAAPEDGETVQMLYERTGDFLREMISREDLADKNILVSTHGAAMTALLNRIKGNLSVAHFWKDEVPPNCSVTIVRIENGKTEILKEGVIFYKEQVKKWKSV